MTDNDCRERLPHVGIVEPLKSCSSLLHELEFKGFIVRDYNDPEGIDYLIIPYLSYMDDTVKYCMQQKDVRIITLQGTSYFLGLRV